MTNSWDFGLLGLRVEFALEQDNFEAEKSLTFGPCLKGQGLLDCFPHSGDRQALLGTDPASLNAFDINAPEGNRFLGRF